MVICVLSNQQKHRMFRKISREKSWICGGLGHFIHRLLYPSMFNQSNWLFKYLNIQYMYSFSRQTVQNRFKNKLTPETVFHN